MLKFVLNAHRLFIEITLAILLLPFDPPGFNFADVLREAEAREAEKEA